MTSSLANGGPIPDLPQAITLTLHQVNEQDLVDAAVAAIAVRIPTWAPTEGATEVLLIESLALLIGQDVYALNQLPRVVLDALIKLNGLSRNPPTTASAVITVTMIAAAVGTQTIPGGAVFRIAPPVGDNFDVQSVGPVTRAATDGLSFAVPVTAVHTGSAPTGVPAGTPVSMIDYYTWVESVALTTGFTGGTDTESDAGFYPRAVAFLARPRTLVLADQFAVGALEVAGCGRAQAYNRWDGAGTLGAVDGHVAVVVASPAGGPVSAPVKTAVGQYLTQRCGANLTVNVLDVHVTPVTITAVVNVTVGADAAAVVAAVSAAIAAAMNPATRAWGAICYPNEIIGVAAKVAGVNRVISVAGATLGAATTPLDLPTAVPTITVTAG